MKLPILIINCKTYSETTGAKAVALAKICEVVANKYKVSIALVVQVGDIYRVSQAVSIPVFSESVDSQEPGKHTGSILAKDVKVNGAVGTLLNHSEKKLKFEVLKLALEQAKKAKLITVVCSSTVSKSIPFIALKPDYIAIEPPSLIGGKISVSTAHPSLISDAVKKLPKVIVGAGVHTKEDVKIAIKLGAVGVLVASGVTQSSNKRKAVEELAKGLLR